VDELRSSCSSPYVDRDFASDRFASKRSEAEEGEEERLNKGAACIRRRSDIFRSGGEEEKFESMPCPSATQRYRLKVQIRRD